MAGGVGARVRSTLMAIKVVLCDDRDRRSFFSQGNVGVGSPGLDGCILANHNSGNTCGRKLDPKL